MSTDSSFGPSGEIRQRMPWLIIARSVSVALDYRMILFAAVALVATVAGWRLLDSVFSGSEDSTLREVWAPNTDVFDSDGNRVMEDDEPVEAPDRAWPWEDQSIARNPDARVALIDSSWWLGTPLVRVWQWLTMPAFFMFRPETGFAGFVCLLLSVIWTVIVWGLFAGAISRYAAVALTTEERLGLGQMFWQARARWVSYVSAPMIPIVAALLFAIPMLIGGWILKIPQVGPFVIGLFFILALIGGLVMAVTLIPAFFGWPFMWSTISTEGSDAMDGCSRCYSYVWQRPLHLICYLLLAGLLSWISLWIVFLLVSSIETFSVWAVSLGAGDELMTKFQGGDMENLASAGSSLFNFWIGALHLVVPAYAFAFFFTAMTAIYLLLRYHVDAAELDEVFLEQEPEPLAPLGQDDAGVPTAPEKATTDTPPGEEADGEEKTES
ncbi:MAG: hypothetical protein MI757_15835 [Pirellulales bacterium]|nr:hypothetical protein [Pirellulales bacterium]